MNDPKYGRRDPIREQQLREELDELAKEKREEPRRDPFGVTIAVFFLAVAVVLAFLALKGGWWGLVWFPFSFFALFGVVGFVTDVRKVPRDEKGRPLR